MKFWNSSNRAVQSCMTHFFDFTFRDTRDMSVWTKKLYCIFYQTLSKYTYLESARRDLQNDVKNLIK